MGAYLNRPIVEKEKEEGAGDGFTYACTTMQGWRASQEDAHNCVVDLHTGWHMFAVYDGHGGTEVAKFTSTKFPDFLKERKFWEHDDIGACLQTAFVDFDDHIRSEDSMKELKVLSGGDEAGKKAKQGEDDSEDEADRIGTIEESGIPLADLLKRYGGALAGKALLSAFMERGDDDSDSSDEDEEEEEGEGADGAEAKEEGAEAKEEGAAEKPEGEAEKAVEAAAEKAPEPEGEDAAVPEQEAALPEEKAPEETAEKKKKVQKRCSKSPIQSEAKKSKSSESEAAGSSSSATVQENPAPAEEEDEDDSDQEFVADEEEEGAEDEEQSDEELEEAEFEQMMLGKAGEVPGEDSGTTACVVLMGNNQVIVANAGDSRAILCRAGKAVDLSVDHKPEDEVETNRIHAAGGAIEDGRVNGGLNLSRALGDHSYKKNQNLELKDQMITAHPDIKIETLTPEDEFLIVACDGIWNSMESQQVVDFARKMLAEGKTGGDVCDALCDACLADSTEGDGTGCDNMTVICTIFKR